MTFDLNRTGDQNQILEAAQTMLDEHFPVERFRHGNGVDRISPLAEFGAFALSLAEDEGGAGFTVVEEALLHTLFGRHLVSPSALCAPIAARIALETGQTEIAGRILTGEAAVCTGLDTDDDVLLFEADGAEVSVVFTGPSMRLLDIREREAETVEALGHGHPVRRIWAGDDGANRAASEAVTRFGSLLLSASLLGIAEATRDLAVQYAGVREQFGRPIGMFQAIKHHCANMAINAERLSALVDMAAIALRDGRDDAPFQIAALRRLAPRIALQNARLAIQIHGGVGFSAEADPHLFVKRAHLLARCLPATDMLSLEAPLSPHH